MTQRHAFPPALPLAATLITALVLIIELLVISLHFDAMALLAHDQINAWQGIFAYAGGFAKFIVVVAVVLMLLVKADFPRYWQQASAAYSLPSRSIFLFAQLLSYAALYHFSSKIFGGPSVNELFPAWLFPAWVLSAALCFLCWCLALLPFNLFVKILSEQRLSILIAFVIGIVVISLAKASQGTWGALSEWTFYVAAILLYLIGGDDVYADIESKDLGLGDFVVNIAPACSGYEGIGLITAFIALHLYMHRSDFSFPKALLLFPLGAITIWLLNCVRIAVLVCIGEFWSEDVAIGGFHSQAGWISFIATSLALIWLAGRISFIRKAPLQKPSKAPLTTAIASLIPIVALLSIVLVSGAFISDFDWLYPLRVIVVAIAIAYCWSKLELFPIKLRIEPLAIGLVVAVIWVLLLGENAEVNNRWSQTLEANAGIAMWLWLAFRFVGTAITVPIAEELAFRGYLLCKLSKVEVITRGTLAFTVPQTLVAIGLSSLAFGFLHGAWIAGTFAGVAYAIVRVRSDSISDAIVAHGFTNALLFGYAAYSGNWYVL